MYANVWLVELAKRTWTWLEMNLKLKASLIARPTNNEVVRIPSAEGGRQGIRIATNWVVTALRCGYLLWLVGVKLRTYYGEVLFG